MNEINQTRCIETKVINFIIKHFGCYKTIGNDRILNSIGTMSFVSPEEFSKVFPDGGDIYFSIRHSDDNITLVLKDSVKELVEKKMGLSQLGTE